MRTVIYGGAVSLDGFLADADGSIDWLHFSKDVQRIITAMFKNVDTILMGRKTYQASKQGAAKQGNTAERSTAEPAMRTYVFSRTLQAVDAPGVDLVSVDASTFVRELKSGPGQRICLMGGGELAQSLIAARLVDEIGVNIHPILLGSGIPVFRDPGFRVKLTLTECRRLDGGCVFANYRVIQA